VIPKSGASVRAHTLDAGLAALVQSGPMGEQRARHWQQWPHGWLEWRWRRYSASSLPVPDQLSADAPGPVVS
jgi:hypothetical protein